jgi:peptide chain release factor 2
LPRKQSRLQELEKKASAPDFWNDNAQAQQVLRESAELTSAVEKADKLGGSISDLEALLELYLESQEKELAAELAGEIARVEQALTDFELARMLSGTHDAKNAILEINSGAGGTEAQDWGEMLLRMFMRWAERRGLSAEILDIRYGEEAGIKNAVLSVEGQNAFGFLRSERGVHRLVRISPFDSNARRHTSFASVSVIPDVEEDINIEVRDDDLRVDTFRSSGAGGQHVNKTDSAVRITHIPTGLVATCQNSRSQHKNRATAMRLLKAKLYELEKEKNEELIEKLAGERRKIDFGSQIRSYVMQPYQLVKDLRTGAETGNVQAVLDGDIDKFIEAYLLSDEYNIPA